MFFLHPRWCKISSINSINISPARIAKVADNMSITPWRVFLILLRDGKKRTPAKKTHQLREVKVVSLKSHDFFPGFQVSHPKNCWFFLSRTFFKKNQQVGRLIWVNFKSSTTSTTCMTPWPQRLKIEGSACLNPAALPSLGFPYLPASDLRFYWKSPQLASPPQSLTASLLPWGLLPSCQ